MANKFQVCASPKGPELVRVQVGHETIDLDWREAEAAASCLRCLAKDARKARRTIVNSGVRLVPAKEKA